MIDAVYVAEFNRLSGTESPTAVMMWLDTAMRAAQADRVDRADVRREARTLGIDDRITNRVMDRVLELAA